MELVCNSCERQTLATDGYWDPECWVCHGKRRVVKTHLGGMSFKAATKAGYKIT